MLDTYQAVGWELGLAPERTRASAFRALQTEITRLATEARQEPLLVLEDLCLVTHFAMDSELRPCLLLVGLTELQRRLAMAVHTSLNQRVVVRQRGAGLAHAELGESVQHRPRGLVLSAIQQHQPPKLPVRSARSCHALHQRGRSWFAKPIRLAWNDPGQLPASPLRQLGQGVPASAE